jgi:hypothetical protein
MVGMTGRFKGIEDAKVFGGKRPFFKPGKYKVQINAVKWVDSSVGSKSYFIIETTVLESNNPDVPVNSDRSHVINYNNVMGQPNVKQFVAAVSGVDPSSPSINDAVAAYWSKQVGEHIDFEGICELLVSSANPLDGEIMELECFDIETKGGDPFTKHNWLPRKISEETSAAN